LSLPLSLFLGMIGEENDNIYFNFAQRTAAVSKIIRSFKRYQEKKRRRRSIMLRKIIPSIVKNIITNSITISEEETIRRNLSAVKIQKTVRGKIVFRSIYENRKNKINEEFRLSEKIAANNLNNKARIIQSAYREYLINKVRIGLISSQEGKRTDSMIIVKRVVCSYIRRNKQKEREKERANETRNEWRLEQLYRMRYIGAVIIQSAYRGKSLYIRAVSLYFFVFICLFIFMINVCIDSIIIYSSIN
jgi:hypothetical protein